MRDLILTICLAGIGLMVFGCEEKPREEIPGNGWKLCAIGTIESFNFETLDDKNCAHIRNFCIKFKDGKEISMTNLINFEDLKEGDEGFLYRKTIPDLISRDYYQWTKKGDIPPTKSKEVGNLEG